MGVAKPNLWASYRGEASKYFIEIILDTAVCEVCDRDSS
jgi:hypothetical protein